MLSACMKSVQLLLKPGSGWTITKLNSCFFIEDNIFTEYLKSTG